MDRALSAKGRILINLEADDWVIYNADDSAIFSLVAGTRARRLPFSLRRPVSPGLYRNKNSIIWFREEHQEVYDISHFRLAGDHQIAGAD